MNVGGGIACALTDALQVYAVSSQTIRGENVHLMRAVNIGMSVHFSVRRLSDPGGSDARFSRVSGE